MLGDDDNLTSHLKYGGRGNTANGFSWDFQVIYRGIERPSGVCTVMHVVVVVFGWMTRKGGDWGLINWSTLLAIWVWVHADTRKVRLYWWLFWLGFVVKVDCGCVGGMLWFCSWAWWLGKRRSHYGIGVTAATYPLIFLCRILFV